MWQRIAEDLEQTFGKRVKPVHERLGKFIRIIEKKSVHRIS